MIINHESVSKRVDRIKRERTNYVRSVGLYGSFLQMDPVEIDKHIDDIKSIAALREHVKALTHILLSMQ